jgi:hypothetical protein
LHPFALEMLHLNDKISAGGFFTVDMNLHFSVLRNPLLNSNQPTTKAMIVPMSVPSATARGGGESRQGMNGHVFFLETLFVLTAE